MGMNFHTLIHRKELSKQKQEQDPHPRAGNKGALSSSSGDHPEKLHVPQENSRPQNEGKESEAADQQTQASSHKAIVELAEKSEAGEDSEEAEDELAAMNREETEAAAIQGLRDALESTDKEASVDIKVKILIIHSVAKILKPPLPFSLRLASQRLTKYLIRVYAIMG